MTRPCVSLCYSLDRSAHGRPCVSWMEGTSVVVPFALATSPRIYFNNTLWMYLFSCSCARNYDCILGFMLVKCCANTQRLGSKMMRAVLRDSRS